MSSSLINKTFIILSCLIFLSACSSTKNIYNNLKIPQYEVPVIKNLANDKIILNTKDENYINFENKIILNDQKNKNQHNIDIIIINKKIFSLNKENIIQEFNLNTGKLISTKTINFSNIANEIIVSFNYLNNFFYVALKSGSILKLDLNGQLIWIFESTKILNTPLKIFNDQIIALYVDEIKNISSVDGSLIWSETYNDMPVYQAGGGQIVNFLNLLFFILPNNRVGSIDLNFGEEHNFVFNEIPLISSINNSDDIIHNFDNYFTYLDEGKYLYTIDILNNNFNLFKKNIKLYSSKIFFNNSLIIKSGKYIHAININNGYSFWLIENKEISPKSSIVSIRSIDNNIEIFLNNGDVLVINNKKLKEIKNLDIKNIKSIIFEKKNTIVNTDSGKTIIF